jgi:hypothetical protein
MNTDKRDEIQREITEKTENRHSPLFSLIAPMQEFSDSRPGCDKKNSTTTNGTNRDSYYSRDSWHSWLTSVHFIGRRARRKKESRKDAKTPIQLSLVFLCAFA